MTSYEDVRELLVGVVERQDELVGIAQDSGIWLDLSYTAFRSLVERRKLPLLNMDQAAVPKLGREIILQSGLIVAAMGPSGGESKATNSLTYLESTLKGSGKPAAQAAISYAVTQIKNVESINENAGLVAKRMGELPGNASPDGLESVYEPMVRCGDGLDRITPTAIAMYTNIRDVIALNGMRPLPVPLWAPQG